MTTDREYKLLKLWKIRQEKEGIDVSKVETLAEAEHFFDKKEEPKINRKELMIEAKELGIKEYNKMRNVDLVKAVAEAKNIEKPVEEPIEIPEIPVINTDVNVSNTEEKEDNVTDTQSVEGE